MTDQLADTEQTAVISTGPVGAASNGESNGAATAGSAAVDGGAVAGPPSGGAAATGAAGSAAELITCPECGTVAMVTLNRRDAHDFCRTCDYPLFWVPSQIVLDPSSGPADQSLRRLPGTVGRATVASLTCPHCAEPNAVTAEICVRCGLPLHPVAAPEPPPPPVVIAPPPEPVAEVIPDRSIPWWVWALICVALAGLIALVTILMLRELS